MNKYFLIAFVVWSVGLVFAGYKARGWEDAAAQESVEHHDAENLAQGFAQSITDDQKLKKEVANDKTPCLSQPLPVEFE